MVSALLIVFLNLLQIAAVGSTVLFIHATHLALKLLKKLKHQNLW
jgi:presenilin-like A22 family membrane protease